MNCKPGDLAIVIHYTDGYDNGKHLHLDARGLLVQVEYLLLPGVWKLKNKIPELHYTINGVHGAVYNTYSLPDKILQPIRPSATCIKDVNKELELA